MKFTIEAMALRKGLDKVRGVIPSSNVIPILGNILVSAENGNLTLTASDFDMFISEAIADVAVEVDGAVAIAGAIFADAVRKLPPGAQLSVEAVAGHVVKCRAGRIDFEVPTLPAAEYPQITMADAEFKFSMLAHEFGTGLSKAHYCHSREETRHYLNGTHMHSDGPQLNFVATDGARLSLYETDAPEFSVGEAVPDMIVPFKTVNEILKLTSAAKEIDTITITGTEAKIKIEAANTRIVSKLIDGTFPDYKRVVPKANELKATADREVMRAAVDRVATFAQGRKSLARGGASTRTIKIEFSKEQIMLKAGEDSGKGSEAVIIDYDGPEFTVGVNANFLLDHLAHLEGRDVDFFFDEKSPNVSPAIMYGRDDQRHKAVLMPVRVHN